MHQDHNLQWHKVASHLIYVPSNPDLLGPSAGMAPKNQATQGRDLSHFARIFSNTVQEFSNTERQKYPAKPVYESLDAYPSESNLFSDEFLRLAEEEETEEEGNRFDFTTKEKSFGGIYPFCRYCGCVNAHTQKLAYWLQRIGPPPEKLKESRIDPEVWESHDMYYSYNEGDLADNVNALLSANQLQGLLQLAQHPYIPVHRLRLIGVGHSFGFDYLASMALTSYIIFNITECCLGPRFLECLPHLWAYSRVIKDVRQRADHDAHAAPHREFFGPNTITYTKGRQDATAEPAVLEQLFGSDLGRLKGYLRMCFSHLVRYDMLMREAGQDPEWEKQIAQTFRSLFSVPIRTWRIVDGVEEFSPEFLDTQELAEKRDEDKARKWEEKRLRNRVKKV